MIKQIDLYMHTMQMKNIEKDIKQYISTESVSKNNNTIRHFIWEVIPTDTPLFKRKCSKCKSSNLYYCSDKFRLNSQKKSIDVWLIYKCIKCDNTCNITILSRTRPELIDKELYQKFMMNDEETAWQYAFDTETAKRNNLESDHSNIEYNIIHENTTFEDIVKMEEDLVEFEIRSNFNLELKLTSLIRQCLDTSSNQLGKMLEGGILTIHPLGSVKKAKVKDGIKVTVNRNKLYTYLKKE